MRQYQIGAMDFSQLLALFALIGFTVIRSAHSGKLIPLSLLEDLMKEPNDFEDEETEEPFVVDIGLPEPESTPYGSQNGGVPSKEDFVLLGCRGTYTRGTLEELGAICDDCSRLFRKEGTQKSCRYV